MKHKYDDATLQAAIDAAFNSTRVTSFSALSILDGERFTQQTTARLQLLKSALDKLPEPQQPTADGKTPGQIDYEATKTFGGNRAWLPWEQLEASSREMYEAGASAVLAAFGGAGLEAAIAGMEAVTIEELWSLFMQTPSGAGYDEIEAIKCRLIAAAREGQPLPITTLAQDQVQATPEMQAAADAVLREEMLAQTQLSTLRPIAEVGEVPAGAVRITGFHDDGQWFLGTGSSQEDTHFADICLPPEAKAPTVEAGKKEMPCGFNSALDVMLDESATANTFTAHDKTWNVHVPGDPMPCDEGREVEVITQKAINEKNWFSCPHDSSYWEWNHGTKIIGWRYADESTPAEPVNPWTPAVGDVVTLKSGGPKMTVVQVDGSECRTMRFDNNQVEVGDFFNATFQLA